MGDLLDLSSMAHLAIGMGQLEQAQRHNDILEQRTQIDRDSQDLTRKRIQYDVTTRSFDEIEKLMKTPEVSLNAGAQVQLRSAQFKLLKHGLGVDITPPTDEELAGSLEESGAFMRTVLKGTPEEKEQAMVRLGTAAPDYVIRGLTALKQMNDLSVQGELLRLKLESGKTQLAANNIKMGQAKMAQGLYQEHLGALSTTIGLGGDKRFKDDFSKVLSYEKPETRQSFLMIRPDFTRPFGAEIDKYKEDLPKIIGKLDLEISARRDAMVQVQSQSETGEAPQQMVEELKGYVAVRKARQAELDWTEDPYNKETWKALKTAQQNLRLRSDSMVKQITDLNGERTAFMQQKFEAGEQSKLATDYRQQRFLYYLNQGHKDNKAALMAANDAKQEFPNIGVLPSSLENYEKKNTLETSQVPSKSFMDAQRQGVKDSQVILDDIGEMIVKIKKSPNIVGGLASMGAGVAGLLQQVRAFGGLGIEENSKLNTKQRDVLEALHTALLYSTAKANDKGSLDIKAVEAARTQLGDISSFTTGYQQVLNKLEVEHRRALRQLAVKRETLGMNGQNALQDLPVSIADPTASSSQQLPRTANDLDMMIEQMRGR